MKAIIYASVHHGNTKKVVEAIAKECEVELIDATQVKEKDLSGYDAIGFASGIYYSKFHQAVLNFASVNLPNDKKVFYICTNGGNASYKSIEEIAKRKHAVEIGRFACKGYDTFGPFKLVGGIAKGHPNEEDLTKAVEFFKGLEEKG
jgi:flavodoxin